MFELYVHCLFHITYVQISVKLSLLRHIANSKSGKKKSNKFSFLFVLVWGCPIESLLLKSCLCDCLSCGLVSSILKSFRVKIYIYIFLSLFFLKIEAWPRVFFLICIGPYVSWIIYGWLFLFLGSIRNSWSLLIKFLNF